MITHLTTGCTYIYTHIHDHTFNNRHIHINTHINIPMQQAICTKGPSFPRDKPAETARIIPRVLINKVLTPKYCLITNPDNIVFTSGIPLPTAYGANRHTSSTQYIAKKIPNMVYMKYPNMKWPTP